MLNINHREHREHSNCVLCGSINNATKTGRRFDARPSLAATRKNIAKAVPGRDRCHAERGARVSMCMSPAPTLLLHGSPAATPPRLAFVVRRIAMSSEFFVHATGLAALVINVCALLCRCEIALRRQSVAAGCLWALNNVLLDAHSAAALSVVSASRTATSASTLECGRIARRNAFVLFATLTVVASLLTWNRWTSGVTLVPSAMSTYAMVYMRGAALRLSMLFASILWMFNAWQYGSWEQMAANVITGCVAAYGAFRTAPRANVD